MDGLLLSFFVCGARWNWSWSWIDSVGKGRCILALLARYSFGSQLAF